MPEPMVMEVLTGNDVGLQITVPSCGAILGRADDCDIPLDEPSLSLKHSRILFERGEWSIHDLGSGDVSVNGRKTDASPLRQGDEVVLGLLRLKVARLSTPQCQTPELPIRFKCECGRKYSTPAVNAGKVSVCKGCGKQITVPIPEPEEVKKETENLPAVSDAPARQAALEQCESHETQSSKTPPVQIIPTQDPDAVSAETSSALPPPVEPPRVRVVPTHDPDEVSSDPSREASGVPSPSSEPPSSSLTVRCSCGRVHVAESASDLRFCSTCGAKLVLPSSTKDGPKATAVEGPRQFSPSPTSSSEQWYYRNEAGSVALGPVDMNTLKKLASTGQLLAYHELSTDGQSWVLAMSVKELVFGRPPRSSGPPPFPPSPASSPEQWYYRKDDGVVLGPVDLDTLLSLASSGGISPHTNVRKYKEVNWVSADDVPTLKKCFDRRLYRRIALVGGVLVVVSITWVLISNSTNSNTPRQHTGTEALEEADKRYGEVMSSSRVREKVSAAAYAAQMGKLHGRLDRLDGNYNPSPRNVVPPSGMPRGEFEQLYKDAYRKAYDGD